MSYSSKPAKRPDRVAEPLAGTHVASAPLSGKGDLSDWVELMDAVEALCPVWLERDGVAGKGSYRL